MGCGVTQFMRDNNVVMADSVLEDVSVNYSGAGVGVKQVLLKAGQMVIQHKHKFSHLSVLVYGKVTVKTDEMEKELEGPEAMVIEAHINHMVTAHTDALWLCVHNTENIAIENLIECLG